MRWWGVREREGGRVGGRVPGPTKQLFCEKGSL